MTTYQVIKGLVGSGVVAKVFAADVDMPAMAAQIDAHQAGAAGMGIASHRVHEGASSGCDVRNRSVNLEAAFTRFPTSAPLSSHAPVGLFYSREGSPVAGRGRTVNPFLHRPVGATPTPRTNPALADGGRYLLITSLQVLPAGAMLAGFFEVTA